MSTWYFLQGALLSKWHFPCLDGALPVKIAVDRAPDNGLFVWWRFTSRSHVQIPWEWKRMQLFCLQLEASLLQLSFFVYSCVWFLLTAGAFLLTTSAFLLTNWSLFAYGGRMLLIRSTTDCDWVLFCPTLRARSSGAFLVNFSQVLSIFPHVLEVLLSFHQIAVNFSQVLVNFGQSILVSFSQL